MIEEQLELKVQARDDNGLARAVRARSQSTLRRGGSWGEAESKMVFHACVYCCWPRWSEGREGIN